MTVKPRWLICVLLLSLSAPAAATCHYQDWRWNVNEKRVVQRKLIIKESVQLGRNEIDQLSGCSVCEEDQQPINIKGLAEFSLCQRIAPRVRDAIITLLRHGARINSVIGYRVGRTRGDIDAQGNRTQFSNHSYGTAFDINTEHNGLYTNCIAFGPSCQLLRGGLWQPQRDPYSLRRDGMIVKSLKDLGFKWGGEIKGRQKDFMHFSLSGY